MGGKRIFRILGAVGYVLVIIGFCMPIACDMSGPSLANVMFDSDKALFGLLLIVVGISAIAGLVIGIIFLAVKGVNISTGVDLAITAVSAASGLVVYFGCLNDEGVELQTGGYVILAGWIVSLFGQGVSAVMKPGGE